MILSYIRCSTAEQHPDRQFAALEKYGVEKHFLDMCSGRTTNRVKLQELKEFAREGDTIYIESFSRLARSTKDLLDLVEFFENRKITLISLKENLDTSTAAGKMMLTILSAIYQFEVDCNRERQLEGIAIAKIKGKYKGRKRIDFPSDWEEVYNKYKCREITGVKAMEMLNLKKNTFYNLIKKWEKEKG